MTAFAVPIKHANAQVYDPTQLADALDRIPIMEAWIEGVREFAYNEAKRGEKIPGYKLVDKRATRKWTDEVQVIQLLDLKGVAEEDYTEKKVLSPTQVEKRLGKSFMADLSEFVVKESSGTALVHESDKRAAVSSKTAAEVFSAA